MNKESRRKIIHILVGFIAFSFIFLDRILIAVIIIGLIGCALAANQFPRIYNYIIREKELDEGMLMGVITYTASILLLTLMFDPRIASAGILALGWGDGFATIIGKKYGKKRMHQDKTLIGSASVFSFSLIGALISFLVIPTAYSIITIPESNSCMSIIIAAIIASALTTINELYFDYDNINVPLTQSISLSILLNLL